MIRASCVWLLIKKRRSLVGFGVLGIADDTSLGLCICVMRRVWEKGILTLGLLSAYLVIFERVTILSSMSNILYLRNFHFEFPRQLLIVNIYHG
jgi:hypothetical protein